MAVRPHYYRLEGTEPVPCSDIHEWGVWYEKADRTVARTERRGVIVSTVFLGLDHNFTPAGRPVLFETLVFAGEHDGDMWRYHTWAEAKAGHARACALVFGGENSADAQPGA